MTSLKPLGEQTLVITGASSGIGLVSARMAAKRGARLVLAARSEEALMELERELSDGGRRAHAVVADVGKREDIQRIVRVAREKFGGFDTWVNNAGVSMYGKMLDEPIEDMRNVFEINFWGLVYGSLEAARYFKERNQRGVIINIGSTLSDRSIILQGMYSASKHAVKGFTDALRMELERDHIPVSVTLIQPGGINTPYTKHAKNYLDRSPSNPPPIYAPETVARTILGCAEAPKRNVFVGAGGKGLSLFGALAPRMMDLIMETLFARQQRSGCPPRPREDNALDRPSDRLEERGDYEGHVSESSLYTRASLHPFLTGAALVGTGLMFKAMWRPRPSGGDVRQGGPRTRAGSRHRPRPAPTQPTG